MKLEIVDGKDSPPLKPNQAYWRTLIDWDKVKKLANKFVVIFSDNDPDVDVTDSKIFKEKLGAKIIIEHNKGHFSDSDNVKELPIVLNSIMELIKK